MQFQKNKLDTSERSNNNKDISTSNLGEMVYIEPLGNQLISPISIGGEKSPESEEKMKNEEKVISNAITENNQNIIKKVENDLKKKLDIRKIKEEKPISSIVVKMPYGDINYTKIRSPKIKNIRNANENNDKNIYSIKSISQRQKTKKNEYHTSTNPKMIDSHNFNSSNDSGQIHQINIEKNNLNKHPNIFIHRRNERGGIIPLNNMSPNLNNYEDTNSSDQKFDITNNNLLKTFGKS